MEIVAVNSLCLLIPCNSPICTQLDAALQKTMKLKINVIIEIQGAICTNYFCETVNLNFAAELVCVN